MQRIILIILLFVMVAISCKRKEEYRIEHSFTTEERDTLLADMITYIYVRPPYSTLETRFDKQYRKYYVTNLNNFRFEKYYRTRDGIHYFYLIRPARSVESNIRGVGGKFRLDEYNNIISFEEIFNTPPATLEVLRERGERLFKEMIKNGNVDNYLHHPDYIEWPDKRTYYDTATHQWLMKPGV